MTYLMHRLASLMTVAGLGLCLFSLSLSAIVFSSISNELHYKIIYSGSAILLEIIKFGLVPFTLYFYFKGKKIVAGFIAIGFICLMAVSVIASIAGLNKGSNNMDKGYQEAIAAKASITAKITRLEGMIDSRDKEILFYQGEERIKSEVVSRRAANTQDLAEIDNLIIDRAAIVVPDRSALLQGIDAVSSMINVESTGDSKAIVYAAFSAIIEIFGALALAVGEIIFAARKEEKTVAEKRASVEAVAADERRYSHEKELAHIDKEKAVAIATGSATRSLTATSSPTATSSAPTKKKAQVIPLVVPEAPPEVKGPADKIIAEIKLAIEEFRVSNPPKAREISALGYPSSVARQAERYFQG